MSVAYGNGGLVAAATRSTTTYTVSGLAQGDLICIVHGAVSSSAPTPPAGFAAPSGTWPVAATGGFWVWMWTKVAGASESGSYAVTSTSETTFGAIFYTTGNDTSAPITVLTQNNGTGTTTTFTGLTTSVAAELIVAVNIDGADTSNTLSAPSGTTPTFAVNEQQAGLTVMTGSLASAGATGNKTMTNNSASGDGWVGILFAVQPPTAAAAPRGGFFF